MNPSQKTLSDCYQHLGKLFYAVAAIDKTIEQAEVEKLKKIVKEKWVPLENSVDKFGEDSAYQIEIVFDWFVANDFSEDVSYQILAEFTAFKKEHPKLFSKELKDLILTTGHAIAAAFTGLNKSELVFLTKLQLELLK